MKVKIKPSSDKETLRRIFWKAQDLVILPENIENAPLDAYKMFTVTDSEDTVLMDLVVQDIRWIKFFRYIVKLGQDFVYEKTT